LRPHAQTRKRSTPRSHQAARALLGRGNHLIAVLDGRAAAPACIIPAADRLTGGQSEVESLELRYSIQSTLLQPMAQQKLLGLVLKTLLVSSNVTKHKEKAYGRVLKDRVSEVW